MKRALILFAAALACILAGGLGLAAAGHLPLWHGLYCSLGTAATDGCDVTPGTPWGRVIAAAVMLLAIPLLAAAAGSVLSERISVRHIAASARHRIEVLAQGTRHHAEMKALAEKHHQELLDRVDNQHEALKAHVTKAVAESQASGGSTPFHPGAEAPAGSRERLDGPPATPQPKTSGRRKPAPPPPAGRM